MLERDLRLVGLTGSRYHAALISNRLSLEAIARAREARLPVTCGVSINHLTLNELDVGDYRTFLKLKPPLRAEDERLGLVEALAAGLIDVICSITIRRTWTPNGAVRGSRGGRDRPRNHALGEPAPCCRRAYRPAASPRAMTSRPAEILRLPVGRLSSARRPTSSASIRTNLMCSIPLRSIRAAAIRPSMRPGLRAGSR